VTDIDLPASTEGNPLASDSGRREPWKFWGSCLWTGLAILVWVVVQFLVIVALLLWFDVGVDLSDSEVESFASHAVAVSIVSIAAAPAELAVIWLAVRQKRWSFADYLALVWPQRWDAFIGLICIAVLLPLADLSSYLTGQPIVPDFVRNLYLTARDSDTIWLLAIALVVAAPLAEELVFRGFMFRGLAASRVGVLGAVLIPSGIWAVMHIQYSAFYLTHIFVIGLLLGWLRWRSGSTTLTLLLHAIINLTSLIQVAFIVERLSA
jgi:membrane protease YdiL (CAAX protease family)